MVIMLHALLTFSAWMYVGKKLFEPGGKTDILSALAHLLVLGFILWAMVIFMLTDFITFDGVVENGTHSYDVSKTCSSTSNPDFMRCSDGSLIKVVPNK